MDLSEIAERLRTEFPVEPVPDNFALILARLQQEELAQHSTNEV